MHSPPEGTGPTGPHHEGPGHGRPVDERDVAAVTALVNEYAKRLDAGDLDGVAALFARGAFRSSRGTDLTGADAVRHMYDPVIIYADGTPRTKHVLGNLDVTVDSAAGTASARCTFTVLQAVPGLALQPVLAGRYHDEFARTDGEWHYVERIVYPDLAGDLTHHMATGGLREGTRVMDALAKLTAVVRSRRVAGRTVVVGIAGAVASGKSTLAVQVRDALVPLGADVVSTDGFLFDNATLSSRGLLMHKGFPDSYDVEAMTRFVAAVRAGTAPVPAPVYSHEIYDVLTGEHQIVDRPDVLIIEGVNVLSALAAVLDLRVYLDADEADLEAWYVKRFFDLADEARHDPASFYSAFAKMPPEQVRSAAESVWRGINLVNLHDHIAPSRALADCVVSKAHDHTVRDVWLRDGPGPGPGGVVET